MWKDGSSEGWPPRRSSDDHPSFLTPPRLLIQADTKSCFRHHLMGEKRAGRMNPSKTRVAQKAFVPGRSKDSGAAANIQAKIHDPPRAIYRLVLGGKDLRRPLCPTIN